MKPLVVYYSHSGNNEKLAIELKVRIGCTIHRISEARKRKTISILLDFIFNRGIKLSRGEINLSEYDPIILVAPIWGGKIASELYSVMNLRPIEVKELSINSLLPDEQKNKIKHTFKYRVSDQDLLEFEKDIVSFISGLRVNT